MEQVRSIRLYSTCKPVVCAAPGHELGTGYGSEDRTSLCLTLASSNRSRS